MRAKFHHALIALLTLAALVGALATFYFAATRLFEPVMNWAMAHLHPLVAMLVFQMLLPPVAVFGTSYLAHRAMHRWIPARCPKCGGHSYRWRDGRHWLSYEPTGEWINYRCRSCGCIEKTGWHEGGGG